MAAIPRFTENAETRDGPHTLQEIAAHNAVTTGADQDAFDGFLHLLDVGAIPKQVAHPSLREGEGWGHYLACCGTEPAPSPRAISLAERFTALREAGIGHDDIRQRSLLTAAVHSRNLPALSALIKSGAKIDFADASGNTALHHAAIDAGGLPAVEALIKATPAVKLGRLNNLDQSALRIAVSLGRPEAVNALLKAGADWRHDGNTPPGAAASSRAGTDPNLPDSPQANAGRTFSGAARPDSLLTVATSNGHAEIVALLLDAGADPDQTDAHGRLVLQTAAENLHLGAVEKLLEKGANANARNKAGDTPLLSIMRHLESIRGADPVGAERTLPSIIGALASNGANLDAASTDRKRLALVGRTPLHWAVAHRHAPSIKLLIELGANPNVAALNGDTPLSLAADEPGIRALLTPGGRGQALSA